MAYTMTDRGWHGTMEHRSKVEDDGIAVVMFGRRAHLTRGEARTLARAIVDALMDCPDTEEAEAVGRAMADEALATSPHGNPYSRAIREDGQ